MAAPRASYNHATLVLHDGDLADVLEILGKMGAPLEERCGGPLPGDVDIGWALIVASPRRILELPPGVAKDATRIAVLSEDSKTLRAMLRRSGIDLMVRRPFHPAALRMLALHCLYRGPEKRRNRRVSIGTGVQFRAGGIRKRAALLTDLSTTGARISSEHAPPRGKRLTLYLGPNVTGGRGLALPAQVVRTAGESDPPEVAIAFQGLSDRARRRLDQIVALHIGGPAVLDSGSHTVSSSEAPREEPATDATAIVPEEPKPDPVEVEAAVAPPRATLEQRISTLGVEASRVLLGRDVSLECMHVDPDPTLALGDRVQIALHVRGRAKALVVWAEVAQDEGPKGLVLRFVDISAEARGYLERMVNFLPILAMRESDGHSDAVIVCEILEHRPPEVATTSAA